MRFISFFLRLYIIFERTIVQNNISNNMRKITKLNYSSIVYAYYNKT